MKNPNDLTYEEFVEFMEQTKEIAEKKYPSRLFEADEKPNFSSIEEFEKYYNVVNFEDYLKKSKEKYGV